MTTRAFLCMVVWGMLGLSVSAGATEIQLAPSSSLRVVNPSDPADVRILYLFTLPAEVQGAEIVRSFVAIPTDGASEAPVTVGPLEDGWTSQDTWTSLEGKLQGSEAFVGLDDRAVIACNWIEDTTSGIEDSGIEVTVTEWVREWVKGGENNGLCVRRLPGRSDDLSSLLKVSMRAPVLTVIYVASGS